MKNGSQLTFVVIVWCGIPVFAEAVSPSSDRGPAIQGEYLTEIRSGSTRRKIGVRLIALGDEEFRSVAYIGGLPGAGWAGRQSVAESKRDDDGSITFKTDRSTVVWRDGKLGLIYGGSNFAFKRIERRSPTLGKKPPKGAVVLFDGKSVDEWEDGELDGTLLKPGAKSKRRFGSHFVHVEFRVPLEPDKRGQARGNSGIYLQGRYELQILDSFGLKPEHNECGGVYSIKKADASMCAAPLAWQTYDIDFTEAKYGKEGQLVEDPRMTVRHNGVMIHKDVELPMATAAALMEPGRSPGPLYLQDHGSEVRFRNIWVVSKTVEE